MRREARLSGVVFTGVFCPGNTAGEFFVGVAGVGGGCMSVERGGDGCPLRRRHQLAAAAAGQAGEPRPVIFC